VPVRVVLAEDHLLVREGIQRILVLSERIDLLAAVADGDELGSVVDSMLPDVVVTDIRMPPSGDGEGLAIAERLHLEHPQMGVLVLSQYADSAYATALFRRGSTGRGYLLKDRLGDGDQLVNAIIGVAAGGSVIDPLVVEALVSARSHAEQSPLRTLTPRELEILSEIASGKSNPAIARELVITRRSVEHHISSIFAKLELAEEREVSRRVQATLLFLGDRESGGSIAGRTLERRAS
jgi:DNA-binding NarL/FixJ family response regulator